ncbi:MAG: rRNA pseudouridine synthase [Clostridia bacterium]|nr:rRNA pseudouridine synthase [Clostridia bacterium]
MRLDKFISMLGKATRSEAGKLIRAGKATVNGIVQKAPDYKIDPDNDLVTLLGEVLTYKKYTYIMLNKPEGYVSATEDPNEKTVLDLVSVEDRRRGLFPCGRLDKNTLGLVILTNDGEGAHRVLSPKHHVSKVYKFISRDPVCENDIKLLEAGVDIGGYLTKPCKIKMVSENEGEITLIEGKYHQIKRMLEAANNKITYLERISFGGVVLDPALKRGEWRYLTPNEEEIFK